MVVTVLGLTVDTAEYNKNTNAASQILK